MNGHLSVERRGADPADVERATAALWAELVFDDHAKAALRRDGLALEGVRITGPSPFVVRVVESDPSLLLVSADRADAAHRDDLLALWQVHFMNRVHIARAA